MAARTTLARRALNSKGVARPLATTVYPCRVVYSAQYDHDVCVERFSDHSVLVTILRDLPISAVLKEYVNKSGGIGYKLYTHHYVAYETMVRMAYSQFRRLFPPVFGREEEE